jgi:hypothetical protein
MKLSTRKTGWKRTMQIGMNDGTATMMARAILTLLFGCPL